MRNSVLAGAAACVVLAAFRVVAPTCCNPTLRWTPQSYTYKFTCDAGVSQQERTDFQNRSGAGASRWNEMFDERNDDTTVTADGQGTITIEVSANHNDLQWSCDPNCSTFNPSMPPADYECNRPYSALNVTAGSTRAAWRAGCQVATSAVATIAVVTTR